MPLSSQKIELMCLNPLCPLPSHRCLTNSTIRTHPQHCSHHFYTQSALFQSTWDQLKDYPNDPIGKAIKQKINSHTHSYVTYLVQNFKENLNLMLKQVQKKLHELYPPNELNYWFSKVYSLETVIQLIKGAETPQCISNAVTHSFQAYYESITAINDSYDELRNCLLDIQRLMCTRFQSIIKLEEEKQNICKAWKEKKNFQIIQYGLYKSKFVASKQISYQGKVLSFPKVAEISSFLPWVYTERCFSVGVHELKLVACGVPIVQNAGLCILEEADRDTYPYEHFKSFYNSEGRGFKLVEGIQIDETINNSAIIIMILELNSQPKAILYDSEKKSIYQCKLKKKVTYRMGIYGCGWTVRLIQLT